MKYIYIWWYYYFVFPIYIYIFISFLKCILFFGEKLSLKLHQNITKYQSPLVIPIT